MKTITLGSLKCSRLAYGCWRLAGTWDPSQADAKRQADGERAVLAAWDAGYTLFDHADIYCDGLAETIFGKVLKQSAELRRGAILASKCGIRKKGAPQPPAPYRYDFSADYIVASCEQSLQRLGVEVIHLYQLHRPDYLCDPDEVAGAFSRLKQAGKVLEFGVSNFRPSQVTALQKACPMRLIVNQVELSLKRLTCLEDGTLDQCLAEKMTPLAWSPLGGGSLVDPNPIDLRLANHAHRIALREIMDDIIRVHANTTRTCVALAWLLKHPAQIVPIIGSVQPDRIREAVGALDLTLSREEWYRLFEAARGERLP